MPALQQVLNKVVVRQFYRENAGFFLVVFFLGFGIQQPPTFIITPAFLSGVASSPVFVGVVLGIFLLYYLKCFNFLLKTLRASENEFLYIASLLPGKTQQIRLAQTFASLFAPAIIYTIWLGITGLRFGYSWPIVMVLLYHFVLLSFTTWYFYRFWQKTKPERQYFTFRIVSISWPSGLWALRKVIRTEKVLLVLTKAFSCSLLFAFNYMYPYPEYDLRPTQIGFLIALMANIMLIRRLFLFNEKELYLLRSLPYSRLTRFAQVAFLLLITLLPEFYLLLRLTPVLSISWPVLELLCFGISVGLLFYVLIYLNPINLETYFKMVFFLFMGLLLLLLCYPPVWLLAVTLLLVAYSLFQIWYYRFQDIGNV